MRRLGARVCLLLFALGAAATSTAAPKPLSVEVGAPDAAHVVWVATLHLAEATSARGVELAPRLSSRSTADDSIAVLPVHEFARLVPAVSVLELPFFFPDLPAVHRAIDGKLWTELRAAARAGGWELLTFWDEGLQLMSGNYPYTRSSSLSGAEFVLLRDDPIAEKELRALDVWTRRARPESAAQLQQECMVSSRAATAQQIARERLARVHLDITLSRHRYEGWVVAMRTEAWSHLEPRDRSALAAVVRETTQWQRERALQEEDRALASLARDGMTVHPLSVAIWRQYQGMQPAWESFLPDAVPAGEARRWVEVAAAAAGLSSIPGGSKPAAATRPRAP